MCQLATVVFSASGEIPRWRVLRLTALLPLFGPAIIRITVVTPGYFPREGVQGLTWRFCLHAAQDSLPYQLIPYFAEFPTKHGETRRAENEEAAKRLWKV